MTRAVTGDDRYGSAASVQLLLAREPVSMDESSTLVGGLERVCGAAVHALSASGAGVSVMSEDGPLGVAAAFDATSRSLEEMQFVVGEGPCMDAFAFRRPCLQPDLDDDLRGRWPGYTAGALEQGTRAVFAFPLQVGGARLGVMAIYRDFPGSLRPDHLALALGFAEAAVTMLLDGQQQARTDEVAGGLSEALEYRSGVYHAQGMVMIQLRVSLAEAMVRLRAHAFAEDRRLAEVAREVVTGELCLTTNGA
ncbi:MAG: GAF and ANTAR domain-containing protein [Actinomycetota bacterium]|nr:GAF and ANTAR domain-containing protein [Actinomycetota bacterium]